MLLSEWRGGNRVVINPARPTKFPVNEGSMEFPRVNRDYWTRDCRYAYSQAVDEVNDTPERIEQAEGGIRKYDLQTGAMEEWLPSPQYFPSKAVFMPAAASGGGEDGGYLCSYVYDKNTDTSAFCIFDAQRIASGPIAQVQLPVRVPIGFHGVWVPDSAVIS